MVNSQDEEDSEVDRSDDVVATTPTRGIGNVPTARTRREGEDAANDARVPATPAVAGQNRGGGGGGGPEDSDSDDSSVSDNDANNVVPNNDQDDDDGGDFAEPLLGRDTVAHIRGTDVHVPTVQDTFVNFLQSFVSLRHSQRAQRTNRRAADNDGDDSLDSDDDMSNDEEEAPPPFYSTKLQAMLDTEGMASLEIDMMHLYYHNEACQRLYLQLIQYPMELVPLMDVLIQRELERLARDAQVDYIPRVQVRPYNLKEVSNLRELDPVNMDTLICCKGMIVRSSSIIPDLKVAHFSCSICGANATVTIDRGRITEPSARCQTCNTAAWQLQHNRCIFADKQLVRLQETPDEVPAGQTPASVVTFCFDDLVDTVMPGDKVEVTGVLRAQPIRVHPKISKVKSVYKTYVDVIHFRKVTGMESVRNENLALHGGKAQWTRARIQELRDLSQDPDIYQKLTDSLAPSIWELENCKKGILCMLFGGNHVRVKKGTAAAAEESQTNGQATSWMDEDDEDQRGDPGTSKLNKRGDINILLCGDPGTSKSQLLSYVNKLSARGVYTSGKGSSAVGLTASVVRDPETRDLVLESGALVLSDLGICCIDEFDKMSETTRSVLHEAMEQQTVSIAKAG
jgi:DNA replication licensing factor MCM4